MKTRSFLLILTILVGACAPLTNSPSQPSITPTLVEIFPLPFEAPTTDPDEVGIPPAALAVRQTLAQKLQIPEESIEFVRIEARDFSNSCLGIENPNIMCAEVITPGYVVELGVKSARWVFHTDQAGSNIVLIQGLESDIGDAILSWQGLQCGEAIFQNKTVTYAPCGQARLAVNYPGQGLQQQVLGWRETHASFEAETPAGKLTFNGQGTLVATPAEQRAMAEWAKLHYDVLQSGRAGAAWGLAFSWSREGGIAGFCDNVSVFLPGYATISNCKGLNETISLTATQLEQMYAWVDGYGTIDYAYTDPAITDAMSTTLSMPGNGQEQADETVVQVINEFCADLLAQASFASRAEPADLKASEVALREFFAALNSGDYILAAKLYGGDTSILQDWNPDIQNDLPAWLERGCTQNGLQCLLPRSVTYRGLDSEGALQYLMEFNTPDGELFRQGPCCGDESGMVSSSFLIRVKERNGLWLVLDLPPYVP